jgi:toxin ParE1/3/4
MRVIYHPAAEAEIIDVAQFYARRISGLEVEFLNAVDQAVAAILESPERWRIINADVRRYLMARFPFAIYYRVLPDGLRILTLKHHSRHSGTAASVAEFFSSGFNIAISNCSYAQSESDRGRREGTKIAEGEVP